MRIETKARIVSVGSVTEKNNFKKVKLRVKIPPALDPDTSEIIRPEEQFDCEYAIRDDSQVQKFREILTATTLCKMVLYLRSFFYKEKDIEKLGHQLILKSCDAL